MCVLNRVQSEMRNRHFVLGLGVFPTFMETRFRGSTSQA